MADSIEERLARIRLEVSTLQNEIDRLKCEIITRRCRIAYLQGKAEAISGEVRPFVSPSGWSTGPAKIESK